MDTSEWRVGMMLALSNGMPIAPPAANGQSPVVVTTRESIQRDHRMEVAAGTEVVWGDPHFDRVWFPPRSDAPVVERTGQGFRAVFSSPATYRGAFTIVGGHRSTDVYSLMIAVVER